MVCFICYVRELNAGAEDGINFKLKKKWDTFNQISPLERLVY